MQFLPNIEEIQYLRFQHVLLQNKDGNRPHIANSPPSLITL